MFRKGNRHTNTAAKLVLPFIKEGVEFKLTQNGPEIPYSYVTVLDWSSVAAQVQADTIPLAIRPDLTLLLAVLNSSLFLVLYLVYVFCV
jgi:hypothetical protein